MKKIILCLEDARDRVSLHAVLKEKLSFPEYYGANLDALYDCLTEIAEYTEIIVPAKIESKDALGGYGERFLFVLQDAAAANDYLRITLR